MEVIAKVVKCHEEMFSELANPAGIPKFLVCTVFYSVQKRSRMHLGIVADWRAWSRGLYSGLYEPIMDHVNFDVFIKKYAAVHIAMSRTFKVGVNLLIILMECHNIVLV